MPKLRFGVICSGGTSASMNAIVEYLSRYCTIQGAELFGFKRGWLGLIQSDFVQLTIESTRGIGLRPGASLLGSYTNGFDSAVRNAAKTIACMAYDGQTMYRHTITECMGRHSGLVTVHAVDLALRQHPDIRIDMVLVPEIPIDIKAICNRIGQTKRPLNIVISEGIKWTDEAEEAEKIAGHHRNLADTCKKLSAVLQEHTIFYIRTETTGYCQLNAGAFRPVL